MCVEKKAQNKNNRSTHTLKTSSFHPPIVQQLYKDDWKQYQYNWQIFLHAQKPKSVQNQKTTEHTAANTQTSLTINNTHSLSADTVEHI